MSRCSSHLRLGARTICTRRLLADTEVRRFLAFCNGPSPELMPVPFHARILATVKEDPFAQSSHDAFAATMLVELGKHLKEPLYRRWCET